MIDTESGDFIGLALCTALDLYFDKISKIYPKFTSTLFLTHNWKFI